MLTEKEINKDEWGTPPKLFKMLDREFNFTLDPCANLSRKLKPDNQMVHLPKSINGLEADWSGQSVFCNPPYSDRQIARWVKKAFSERERAKVIVMLIPVRADRAYFHNYIINHAEIRFIRGRPRFIPLMGQNRGSPTFSSMIVIFRKDDVITKGLTTLDVNGD